MTAIFIERIGQDRNLFNVHLFASRDSSLPILGFVRLRYRSDVGRLYLTATDKYTVGEVAFEAKSMGSEGENFEVFVHYEDVARVGKMIKAGSKLLTVQIADERAVFEVDGTEVSVPCYQDGAIGGKEYPSIDRLWPDAGGLAHDEQDGNVGTLGINARYLDRYRRMNRKSTGGEVRMGFSKEDGSRKPVVVLPSDTSRWRGLIMPIRYNYPSAGSVKERYVGWDNA